MTEWYVARAGVQLGPFSDDQLQNLLRSSEVTAVDLVWKLGMPAWQPISEVFAPPPLPPQLPPKISSSVQSPNLKTSTTHVRDDSSSHLDRPPETDTGGSVLETKTNHPNKRIGKFVALGLALAAIGAIVVNDQSWKYGWEYGRVPRAIEGAVVGGVLGVAVASIAHLIARMLGKQLPHGVMIALVIMSISGTMSTLKQHRSAPVLTASVAKKLLIDTPEPFGHVYKLIEQNDPALMDRLASIMISSSKTNETAEQIGQKVRAEIISANSSRIPYLENRPLLDVVRHTIAVAKELNISNPKMCAAMLQGKPFGDLRPYISALLVARESEIMALALSAKPGQIDLLPAEVVKPISRKIIDRLSTEHPTAIKFLDPVNMKEGDERAACLVNTAFMQAIIDLPEAESAPYLRVLYLVPDRL